MLVFKITFATFVNAFGVFHCLKLSYQVTLAEKVTAFHWP